MINRCEELENWSNFSDGTKEALLLAETTGYDAAGLFMTKKFNCNEMIGILQALADPNLAGELLPVDAWKNRHLIRVRGVASDVDFYSENKYNSYALIALPSDSSIIQVPLVNNYTNSNIYKGEVKCPRFEKLVKIFNSKLKKPVEFKSLSTNKKYYCETKTSYEIYNKLDFLSTFKLNEFDKVVLMANLTARELLNEFVANNPNALNKEKSKLNNAEIELAKELTNDLLTLAIVRSIDLGDPEIAFRIDEALKLQLSNDLGLASSSGSEIVKYVASLTQSCTEHLTNKLDFSVERIQKNMENMGFKYKKHPTNVIEAIFGAGNLERTYGVQFKVETPALDNVNDGSNIFGEFNGNGGDGEVKALLKQQEKVFHALAGPALQRKIKSTLKVLPGLIDEQILTKKQREEDNFEVVTPGRALECILGKKGKEHLFAPVIMGYDIEKAKIITKVIDGIKEQREEDFGKSVKRRLNDALNTLYNEDTNKRLGTGTIIRGVVKNEIKKNIQEEKLAKKNSKKVVKKEETIQQNN